VLDNIKDVICWMKNVEAGKIWLKEKEKNLHKKLVIIINKYDLKLIKKWYININFKYILVMRIVFNSYKFLFLNLKLIFILFDSIPLLIDFNLLGYEYRSSLFIDFYFILFFTFLLYFNLLDIMVRI